MKATNKFATFIDLAMKSERKNGMLKTPQTWQKPL